MTGALNRIVRTMYAGEYRRFLAPCDVRRVQMGYLGDLLQKNAATVYGRRYGFGQIRDYRRFARTVPLTTYEDYAPYIERIADGGQGILTAEPVRLLEPTSGSSGGRKLIPYTASLQAEFQRGIRPWLCDLYTRIPGVCDGMSYWSVTPVTQGKEFTPGGIPIGFEDDAAYFGRIEQALMRRIFAVDGSVKFTKDMAHFWEETATQLLRCNALSLISVWNPTYLTILCDYIREHAHALARRVPECRMRLRHAQENRFDRVFPALRVISCWADGSAAEDVPAIRARFPGVYLQPKGLLATECFVSLPLTGEEGSRLCIRSHFFEFRSLATGRIVTADRLHPGTYELIVTTGGGFYRYCIGDVIEVLETDPAHPPRIRFLRRSGITSDLCGEKLTEDFVRGVCLSLGLEQHFCLLAPEGRRYCLYTTADLPDSALDAALREGYHYQYCRELGQLQCAHVIRVSGDPDKAYLARLTAEGMRLGDIKPAYLSRLDGWKKWLCP
ncbi:MAG: GH3 auxin-responsive promoter family protein [Oscillospiraceae bacterium]|nr:GH3 auxin-responsive promoter family protein [Oscillospiraceae bacterium]